MKHLAIYFLAGMGLMAAASSLRAQTFESLYSFALGGGSPKTNSDGQAPYDNLVLSGGTLYGTTYDAGTNGSGTVFSIRTNGSGFAVLHSFAQLVNGTNADGANPYSGLVLSSGTLYGTTYGGGTNGLGTVFSVLTNGAGFSVLHTFTNGFDGAKPSGGLVLLGNTLYGTTAGLGSNNSFGTIFSLTTNVTAFTSLHSFNTSVEGGSTKAGLTLFSNAIYGTTYSHGSNGAGSIFSVNTNGTGFAVLHSFVPGTDGGNSEAPLLASGNTLFGTASSGGANNWGTVYSLNGTTLTVLYTFTGGADGGIPAADLVLAGNTLYGMAQQGGFIDGSGSGTVFSVRTNGAGFVTLHTFGGQDGSAPFGGLVLSGKTAFGTTSFGGTNGANGGTVFSMTIPVLAITNFAVTGTNAVFGAVDGLAGGTYSVLMNSNLAPPGGQWKTMATTTLTTNGPFVITATNAVNPSAPQEFYIIQLQ